MSIVRRGEMSLDRRGGIVGGCLVVLAILVVLAVAGGIFVAMNLKTWTADWTVQIVEAGLEKSELSEEQKSAIMVHVQDLADGFKAGDVTFQQVQRIGKELISGPIIPVAVVYGARKQYIDPSGLSEEEKLNANLQMERLARGVFEKKIDIDELEDAVDEIAVRTREDQWQLRDPEVVDDKGLREMVGKITALVDEKEIPAEHFEVDVAAEVAEAIDRGLHPEQYLDETPQLEGATDDDADPEGDEAGEPEGDDDGAPEGHDDDGG